MTMVADGPVGHGRRIVSTLLLVSPILLQIFPAFSLSVAPQSIHGRSSAHKHVVTPRRSALFATRSTRPSSGQLHSPLFPSRQLASTKLYASKVTDGPNHSSAAAGKKLALRNLLSKIRGNAIQLRRSILRTAAILSFVLLGFTRSMTAPAHAAKSKPATVEVVSTEKSSFGRKVTKLFVTAGAVVAGAAVSNKARGALGNNENGNEDNDASVEDIPRVVPKDEPSPLPLSSEWIESQLKEVENEKQKPKPKPSLSSVSQKDPILVKDLDSKIEMLRVREERAKADAEQKRLEDIAKAAEVRKQEQLDIDARIAAEAEKVKSVQRERAQREQLKREKELAQLEQGKKEQWRLEQILKDQSAKDVGKVVNQASGSTGGDVNGSSSSSKDPAAEKRSVPVNINEARQQPKSLEEEQLLKEKYGSMDLEERAFNILVDLGMVDLHSDPDTASLDPDDDE